MLGHQWPASVSPLKWCFAGGSMMARFSCYFGSSLPLSLQKKTLSELDFRQNFLDPHMIHYLCSNQMIYIISMHKITVHNINSIRNNRVTLCYWDFRTIHKWVVYLSKIIGTREIIDWTEHMSGLQSFYLCLERKLLFYFL